MASETFAHAEPAKVASEPCNDRRQYHSGVEMLQLMGCGMNHQTVPLFPNQLFLDGMIVYVCALDDTMIRIRLCSIDEPLVGQWVMMRYYLTSINASFFEEWMRAVEAYIRQDPNHACARVFSSNEALDKFYKHVVVEEKDMGHLQTQILSYLQTHGADMGVD
jgi:hypothetical protein